MPLGVSRQSTSRSAGRAGYCVPVACAAVEAEDADDGEPHGRLDVRIDVNVPLALPLRCIYQ